MAAGKPVAWGYRAGHMPRRIKPRRQIKVYLREWREHLGLSQEAVGNRFHPPVERGTISRFELSTRNLSLNVLAAFAEALRVPVAALYRPPTEDESLDEIVAGAPKPLQKKARELLTILVKSES